MKIRARFNGRCARCGDPVKAGDEVEYDPECKSVMHLECAIDAEDTEASPIKPVQAGTTARYRKPEFKAQDGVTKFLAVVVAQPARCYACDGPEAIIKIQEVTICNDCAEELIAELKARRS